MESIATLLAAESEIKSSLKRKRAEIKAAIEDSVVYKTVLEATMHPTEGPEVPLKVARPHAFKVAKASYAAPEAAAQSDAEESDE